MSHHATCQILNPVPESLKLISNYINMKIQYTSILLIGLFLSCTGQEIPNKDFQITSALMAVPDQFKDGAKVLGFDADGNMIILREGTNEMTCVADDY